MASSRSRGSEVCAIVGADSFRAEEALERLLAATVGPERTDAVEVLRGDEGSWARVLDAARTRSLFAARRVVVVRGAELLKGSDEEVQAYLGDPTPGVTLVLMAAKPDRRRAVWKRILERAEVVSAEPLKGRALRAYVVDHLRRRSLILSEEGLEELLERVGQDLRRLMGEIDKLEAFGGGRTALSAEEVASVLGRGLARPLYRLGDAMIGRRREQVLELVGEVLEEGEAPPLVLGTLHRALRQVRGARALRDSRAPREEIASRLRVPPFKVGDLLEATRRWSEDELKAAFAALGLADRRVKLGVDPGTALAAAVTEACGARNAPRPGR